MGELDAGEFYYIFSWFIWYMFPVSQYIPITFLYPNGVDESPNNDASDVRALIYVVVRRGNVVPSSANGCKSYMYKFTSVREQHTCIIFGQQITHESCKFSQGSGRGNAT